MAISTSTAATEARLTIQQSGAETQLVTPRVILRPLRDAEARRLKALLGHWEIIRWLAIVPWPYGLQDAHDYIATSRADNAARGIAAHCAITDRATGQLMGHIDLRIGNDATHMELGYWLGMPFWGRGVMSEAIQGMVDYGFQHLDLARITAVTHSENQQSRRALEKCGFHYRGLEAAPYRPNRLRGSDMVHAYEIFREKIT
jgi:[ribosomal protein S5]-alanine N-acetyltransferase